MPRNKEALIRYRVIDRVLVNRRQAGKEELKEAVSEALDMEEISDRTFYADIHAMRNDSRLGYFAPIVFNRQIGKYHYSEKAYSINKLPLAEEDIDSLRFAARLLDQYTNVEIFRHFTGAVQKIVDTLNIRQFSDYERALNFVEFEHVPRVGGNEYINPILKAIDEKTVLLLHYHSFTRTEATHHLIHPYLLKQYRNRWYVYGWHEKHQAYSTFALDRIEGLEAKYIKKYTKPKSDPREQFKNIVGITTSFEGPPPEIRIRIDKPQAYYTLTQPIHESQKVLSEDEKQLIIELKVHPTPELEIVLMGMADQCEVLWPLSFREKIKDRIQQGLRTYRPRS